ncbi:30S ribosomal protein S27ae [Candidatus Bathyarchaeota archaeon]|nr:30S ribosomal protein S27ae [Candidatus Bathyarchaeota archaeon]
MSVKKDSAPKTPVKKTDSISKQYQIKDGKIERKRPFCNRCGRGYFMADHGNRYTCGNCGFTIFKSKTD